MIFIIKSLITKFSPAKNEVVWFNDDYNFHHTFNVNEIEKYSFVSDPLKELLE